MPLPGRGRTPNATHFQLERGGVTYGAWKLDRAIGGAGDFPDSISAANYNIPRGTYKVHLGVIFGDIFYPSFGKFIQAQ